MYEVQVFERGMRSVEVRQICVLSLKRNGSKTTMERPMTTIEQISIEVHPKPKYRIFLQMQIEGG